MTFPCVPLHFNHWVQSLHCCSARQDEWQRCIDPAPWAECRKMTCSENRRAVVVPARCDRRTGRRRCQVTYECRPPRQQPSTAWRKTHTCRRRSDSRSECSSSEQKCTIIIKLYPQRENKQHPATPCLGDMDSTWQQLLRGESIFLMHRSHAGLIQYIALKVKGQGQGYHNLIISWDHHEVFVPIITNIFISMFSVFCCMGGQTGPRHQNNASYRPTTITRLAKPHRPISPGRRNIDSYFMVKC